MSFLPPAFASPGQPLYVPYDNTTEITANIQVSTLMANKTGAIVLTADAINPDVTTPIIFDRISSQQPVYLAMNSNATGVGAGSNQVTVMNSLRTAYDDVAANGLYLYGNGVLGNQPVARFVEQGLSGRLNIESPQVNISTLNSLNIIGVSTINGQPVGGGGGGGNTFSTLFVTSTANISSLLVSSINGAEFTSTSITVPSITAEIADLAKASLSTIQFNPSVGGITPNIDLGMGGFLGGVAGGLGSGVFNTALGVTALATGIAGLTMPRTIVNGVNTNINPSTFELVNGTTQLQVSTLGAASSNVLRLVSSSAANVPGREIFISSIIAPGTTCIRSLSDPLNLANSTIVTSSLQSFGQWVPLPTGGGGGNVIPDLVVSSINSISWDQIQYANQQSVITPGNVIVVDATNQYLYVGATILSPVPTYEFQVIILDPGIYSLSEFVDMVDAASVSQGVAAGQLRFGLNGLGNIAVSLNPIFPTLPYQQTYLLIWNSTPPANFPFASFTPPITAPALAASSAIFGAAGVNILLQTVQGPSTTNLPQTPTYTPNPVGPISFGANLQVSSIAFPTNANSNAGAIQIDSLFGIYNIASHGSQPAYLLNPATSLGGTSGSIFQCFSPNLANQCALVADNTNGPQIIATTSGGPGQLTVRASQMNISSISLSSINGAVYPPSQSPAISSFQTLATSSFTVSSINGGVYPPPASQTVSTFQTLFTSTFSVSTINNVNWSTISLQNQGPAVDPANRNWVVTASNNILCVTASNPTPPPGFIQSGVIPLTIGTYDNTSFPVMVNAAIQAFSAANGGRFGNLVCSITSLVGVIVSASFSSSQPAPTPPLIGIQYTLDFTPSDFASFPGSTALLIAGSAALFGATNPSTVVIIAATPGSPAATVVLPIPNTNRYTGPITPFGPNLQVSSINVQGVPVLTSASQTPTGAIIIFGGVAAPFGWLLCDGSTYSSAAYPSLFAVIGYLYGGSAGNFQVPDLQTRIPVGCITGTTAPASATMTLPGFGGTSTYVIIQLGPGPVSTTPLNVIVPGCVFTTGGGIGPFTVVNMNYADYGRNVYFCEINATLGGGGGPYVGTISYPKSSVASANTTLPYQPGFTAPAYYAPSLAPRQIPGHTHLYNVQVGGGGTYNSDGGKFACGDPNNFFQTNTTTAGATQGNSGGVGFDTTALQFPPGLIGPSPLIAFGVQPLPTVSVNYIIKV